MNEMAEIYQFAKDNGAFGLVLFGAFLFWFALQKKVIVTDAMSELKSKNAALEKEVEYLKKHIVDLENRLSAIEGKN